MKEQEKRKCRTCFLEKELQEYTQVTVKNKQYYVTRCKPCTAKVMREKRELNPELYKEINRQYRRRLGIKPKRVFATKEEQYRNKLSNKYKYKKRIKSHRNLWDQELTDLVTSEAHDLRLRRNKCTNVKWHVDHIIPLLGKQVSGLHIWNNLQVIPAKLNMSKGNRLCQISQRF